LLSGLLAGLLCGILYGFELWWLSLVFFTLIYLVENFRKPIMTGLVADEVSNEILTSVLSAQSQLQTVIIVILSLILGFVADIFNVGVAIAIVSILMAVTVLIIQGFKKWNQ
jgi:hypothetical protein